MSDTIPTPSPTWKLFSRRTRGLGCGFDCSSVRSLSSFFLWIATEVVSLTIQHTGLRKNSDRANRSGFWTAR